MARNIKSSETHKLHINAMSHDGRGIAHVDNKVWFVENALTGEDIIAVILKNHKRFVDAKAIEIIKPSPLRVEPPCQYFTICGGCSLQHLDPTKQVEMKLQYVLEQLQHFGKIVPQEILPPLQSKIFGYRHRARLGVKFIQKKNEVYVGFREKNSHFLTDLADCKILHPRVSQLLTPLKHLVEKLSIKDAIPQVEVAVGTEKISFIVRHLKDLNEKDQNELKIFAKTHQIDLFLQPKGYDSIYLFYPEQSEDQLLHYSLSQFNLELFFKPDQFSQVNPTMNEKLVEQVIKFMEPQSSDKILDLFCGIGNFSLPLAKFSEQVVGIEGNQSAVDQAAYNAIHNHINNIKFYVEDLSQQKTHFSWLNQSFNKVLLDPPRIGAETILSFIHQIQPERIIYVSCNPATLARDCGILAEKFKYKLTKLQIVDMFPHTSHIESIAVLEKNG